MQWDLGTKRDAGLLGSVVKGEWVLDRQQQPPPPLRPVPGTDWSCWGCRHACVPTSRPVYHASLGVSRSTYPSPSCPTPLLPTGEAESRRGEVWEVLVPWAGGALQKLMGRNGQLVVLAKHRPGSSLRPHPCPPGPSSPSLSGQADDAQHGVQDPRAGEEPWLPTVRGPAGRVHDPPWEGAGRRVQLR